MQIYVCQTKSSIYSCKFIITFKLIAYLLISTSTIQKVLQFDNKWNKKEKKSGAFILAPSQGLLS